MHRLFNDHVNQERQQYIQNQKINQHQSGKHIRPLHHRHQQIHHQKHNGIILYNCHSLFPYASSEKIPVPVKEETIHRAKQHQAQAYKKMHAFITHIPEIPEADISCDNKCRKNADQICKP
jgi:hypothetical protein